MKVLGIVLAGAALWALAPASSAETTSFPSKPVRIVVPFAAGGPSDAVARTIARALSQSLAQPVVVENKPGAGGQIAAQAVATAAPDGHTLLLGGSSTTAGLAALKQSLPFNPMELTPISTVAAVTFALYASPDVPARSVAELVGYAKAHPERLNYAVSAHTEFMAAAQLMKATGARMVRVNYKGSAQAVPELLAGRVQVYFAPLTAERIAYAKDGRLRLLAVVAPQRSAFVPAVPTMLEAGVAMPGLPGWTGLLGPSGMPREVVRRLADEVARAVADPEVRSQLERLSLTPGSITPDEMGATMRADFQLWSDFVRDNGIPRD